LFESAEVAAPAPVSRAADEIEWRDPQSGYRRRNVSPDGYPSPIQIVEVAFPAGARVAYDTGPRWPRVHQQVWVLDGSIAITVGGERFRLSTGDCLAMQLDQPVSFHNPTRKTTRYAVVLSTELSTR
jgi:quercetin dioxygenase-like cupin family protein